ncbi:hypothetical protein CFC35_05520 [Streptomyces sp. FBKL.4005]|uniref:WhiB family transcriptional regulator n=1 Tax=Streptomyces sp. FBKL.4005 TaxID=2015515 RepID=UPI000B970512|nr:WhiB family transcriptional regulator [Streptomyces sp. FBKL.4005]OYP14024.1 hypothetical protein CFC35_05520 [Streptomyces sp. FBKL.4005]
MPDHSHIATTTTWHQHAACRADGISPDVMFPDNDKTEIERAKAVCRGCSVWKECLLDALATGDTEWGIRGGLRPEERRKIANTGVLPKPAAPAPARTPKPAKRATAHEEPPKTLAEAFARRTVRTDDGHVIWYGAKQIRFQGVQYTALRVAFAVGHGREPEGPLRRTCGRNCYRADHLTDARIRAEQADCGTTAGYLRHRRNGEATCGPCRKANTAANYRPKAATDRKAAA